MDLAPQQARFQSYVDETRTSRHGAFYPVVRGKPLYNQRSQLGWLCSRSLCEHKGSVSCSISMCRVAWCLYDKFVKRVCGQAWEGCSKLSLDVIPQLEKDMAVSVLHVLDLGAGAPHIGRTRLRQGQKGFAT
jgi:hypothetical protein